MTLCGTGAGRRAIADHGAALDERRGEPATVFGFAPGQSPVPGQGDGRIERLDIVAVDAGDHIPAIGLETAHGVVAKPGINRSVNRDRIVVIENNQLGQPPDTGERTGFMRNAFHQAAVTHEGPGEVIDDIEAVPVELRCQRQFGKRHADRIGQPLPERAGGGLDPRGHTDLRVTRRFRVKLSKRPQLVDRQVVAGQMQQCIEQHRAMAIGEYEAITIEPARLRRIVFEVTAPERDRDIGHPHRHPGMPGIRLLDRIHGKRPDGAGHAMRLAL